MGQGPSACTVTHCCSTVEGNASSTQGVVALRGDLSPEVRLIAWFRRRSGPDCDFGEQFEELFGGRGAVGEAKFASVVKDFGALTLVDGRVAFQKMDTGGKGALGAEDLEIWQEKLEMKEIEALREWRDWLRKRYATPSAAYNAMGKGEGDVLVETEFSEALEKLGFKNENPMELFRCVDKDFSGEVTFAEFKAAMRSVAVKRVKQAVDSKPSSKTASGKKSSKNGSAPHSSLPRHAEEDEEGSDAGENASQTSSPRHKGDDTSAAKRQISGGKPSKNKQAAKGKPKKAPKKGPTKGVKEDEDNLEEEEVSEGGN